jgi:hypothetical protein
MWQYAPSEADYVQDFVDFSLAWFERYGYTLVIDVDMARWTELMAQAMTEPAVNPTFNPRFNALSSHNSFWLDIRAGSHTVATSAARHFITEDYFELMQSMKLWRDHPPPTRSGALTMTRPPEMPVICGSVGHEGGLWVHPTHRKRGLSVILPHLTRALCLRQWNVDWQTGVARRAIGECGIVKWGYGMPHVEPCFEGYFPLTQSNERLFIAYMSRGELVAGLEPNTVARLLPDSDQEMADPAIRAHQR